MEMFIVVHDPHHVDNVDLNFTLAHASLMASGLAHSGSESHL